MNDKTAAFREADRDHDGTSLCFDVEELLENDTWWQAVRPVEHVATTATLDGVGSRSIVTSIAVSGMLFVACGLDVSGQGQSSTTTIPNPTEAKADGSTDAPNLGDGADIPTCIKCGADCVTSCAKCSGKTSECDGVCVDGCDKCPGKPARCPGACVPGTTTQQATCRALKTECRDIGCACNASPDCVNGDIVCDLGRCVSCDSTNDAKGLKCSDGDSCDSSHCD